MSRAFVGAVLRFAVTAAAVQAVFAGRVVGINDDDMLTLSDAGKTPHRMRLDAPENAQPFNDYVEESLSELAFGKDAAVRARLTFCAYARLPGMPGRSAIVMWVREYSESSNCRTRLLRPRRSWP